MYPLSTITRKDLLSGISLYLFDGEKYLTLTLDNDKKYYSVAITDNSNKGVYPEYFKTLKEALKHYNVLRNEINLDNTTLAK